MRHQTGSMLGGGGLRLHTQAWLPDAAPQSVVILVHGLGEHSSRYGHVAAGFVNDGHAVCTLDHRGHGQSEGRRVQVRHYGELVDDIHTYVAGVRAEHPGLPMFMLGHSMGGLVALAYVISHRADMDGLIVSATAAAPPPNVSRFTIALGKAAARVVPHVGVATLPLDKVSRDPEVVRAYFADPTITRNKVRARMGSELLAAMAMVDAAVPALTLPVLVLHGGSDAIADVSSSRRLYERLGSTDKQLIVYPELWHEIFNEPERDQVINDVIGWLHARRHVVQPDAQTVPAGGS